MRRIERNTYMQRGLLFNVYDNKVFKEAFAELEKGINIKGKNNVGYADDTVLIAYSIKTVQLLLDKVHEARILYEPNTNKKKTK